MTHRTHSDDGAHHNTETKHSKSSRKMLYFLLGLAVAIVLFLVGIYPLAIAGAPDTADIRISRNASYENIADTLRKYFGPKYSRGVMQVIKARGIDPASRYGLYHIEEGTSAIAAARRLSSGAQTPVKLTINGFRSLPTLIERISARFDFPADSLRALLEDPATLAPYGLRPESAMGLFFNNSFELYWTASPRDVIKKFGDYYNKVWRHDMRRKANMLGYTPEQITILSSIVDEETNKNAEKGTIGRLYMNRLKKGMKLQADPTIRFALGDYSLRRIRQAHLSVESPYNTYLHPGLPPGPIRTPSKETIALILESKPNDYLYMCAREDFSGRHNFARTFAEHKQNALRYREALNARGIQ